MSADSRFFQVNASSVAQLAEVSGCHLATPDYQDRLISNINGLADAAQCDVSFLSNEKYIDQLSTCSAGACVIHPKHASRLEGKPIALLLSDNPYHAYGRIATHLFPTTKKTPTISPQALISPDAKIGKNCHIAAGVIIERDVVIGDDCILESGCVVHHGVLIGNHCHIGANSVISYCHIGDDALIYAGVCIGQDGFGFATEKGQHYKVPQLGRVLIGNDVEIGANSCIDRGSASDTVIGDGCRIDNLVQIGHNVKLGRGCVIVSQAGVSGSTICGDYVVIGGQAGIAGHLSIGMAAQIAGQSGVTQDIPAQQKYGGTPAQPIGQWHRQTIHLKKMLKKQDKK